MSLVDLLKKMYFWSTGYSYTNLGRLFLRLFVGVMFLQFGVRQWMCFPDAAASFPSVAGMSPSAALVVMICIEIICSLFIMVGFCTRIMSVPPFISMVMAEYNILSMPDAGHSYLLSWLQPGFLPVMFMGIYFFILLVGPGKISVDYFLSLHIIHTDNRSETELEEV